MNRLLFSLSLLIFVYFIPTQQFNPILSLNDLKVGWTAFKAKHNKLYTSLKEEAHRIKIFGSNLKRIFGHNNNSTASYKLGVTRFADWTKEEFRKYVQKGHKGVRHNTGQNNKFKVSNEMKNKLPKSVDWRPLGYVNPIKNQGSCGCCWTFSTVAALEGQYYRKYGQLLNISEQNLVDCVFSYLYNAKGSQADGCNGGDGNIANTYIKKNGGINLASSYPFIGSYNGKCLYDASKPNVQINGHVVVSDNGDEDALTAALAQIGPMRISIYVTENFQHYVSGIFYEKNCPTDFDELNHEVALVGYDKDYYILRNQWGENWGESGYMKIARNKNNLCGLATDVSYPIVK